MTYLKDKIIQTLSSGEIKMIPKWRLILYSFAAILGALFLFLIVVFSFSFIFFVLSRYGFMYLPMFGFMTTLHMLSAIPLLLLLCTVALIFVIELISRKYAFSFRKPLIVTLLSITSLAVVLSFIISITPMHEYMRDYAKEHDIPIVSKAYRRPIPLDSGRDMTVLRGMVVTASSSFITVRLFDGVEVTARASTTLGGLTLPAVNSDVLLFGSFVNADFEIIEIKNAPRIPFEKRRRDMHNADMKRLPPQDEINMFRQR